jgi:hypothetical protein
VGSIHHLSPSTLSSPLYLPQSPIDILLHARSGRSSSLLRPAAPPPSAHAPAYSGRPSNSARPPRPVLRLAVAAEHADGGGCSGQNRPVAGLTGQILTGSEVPVREKRSASTLEVRGTLSTSKLGGWTTGGG